MPGGRGPEPRGYAMNGDVDPRDLQDNYRDVSSHCNASIILILVATYSDELLKNSREKNGQNSV